ncbi:MAG TPA: hypothetical protein PK385_11675 [Spirochaetota bacterium]|nr:hypothetical protein [Spirochaetota bacterium]HOS33549.1 hypothetical protein [Spirochaetota bacterium]HOS56701.1 hypothetical protein [Spirochaetota bacterium]HQF78971.1 hypothetical protein [Spirochaetota bacterium]HQH31045.1 hypothetical protein [Spirochaetota bacterium]
MDKRQIAPNVSLETVNEGSTLIFTLDHSKMDRLNIMLFPFVIICVLGFIFLLFLYGAIVSLIYSYNYDIVYFEAILGLLIIISVIWGKHKLKKAPKYESFLVSKDSTNIILTNDNAKSICYDLKDIKGAWLYEYIINGALMATYIVLSKNEGHKKIRDDSPLLLVPVHLSTSEKLKSIYTVILFYIEEHYPWVTIGHNNGFWRMN